MKMLLIRHGETDGNGFNRYIGRTDEPLSDEGESKVRAKFCREDIDTVFTSGMKRTAQTATILFPKAKQTVLRDLREMDFGKFEGKSAEEMQNDSEYQAWVEGGCESRCPDGEGMAEFKIRVCHAFEQALSLLDNSIPGDCAMVVHGGTIMAIMEKFAPERRRYFDWHVENCGGYELTLETDKMSGKLKINDYNTI